MSAPTEQRYESVPPELQTIPNWVGWKYGAVRPNGKPAKEPLQPDGSYAKPNDPSTWAPLEDFTGQEQVGFNFKPPYVGIDLDNAVTEDGEPHGWAQEIFNRFCGAYIEISPSGKGYHLIVKGTWNGARNHVGDIEVYDRGRYFTATDDAIHIPLRSKGIAELQDSLDWLAEKYFPEKKPTTTTHTTVVSVGSLGLPLSAEDQAVVERMKASKRGTEITALLDGDTSENGDDHSAADLALADHLNYWTNGNLDQMDRIFRHSGLMREKWDESRGETTYGLLTLGKALESPLSPRGGS